MTTSTLSNAQIDAIMEAQADREGLAALDPIDVATKLEAEGHKAFPSSKQQGADLDAGPRPGDGEEKMLPDKKRDTYVPEGGEELDEQGDFTVPYLKVKQAGVVRVGGAMVLGFIASFVCYTTIQIKNKLGY